MWRDDTEMAIGTRRATNSVVPPKRGGPQSPWRPRLGGALLRLGGGGLVLGTAVRLSPNRNRHPCEAFRKGVLPTVTEFPRAIAVSVFFCTGPCPILRL